MMVKAANRGIIIGLLAFVCLILGIALFAYTSGQRSLAAGQTIRGSAPTATGPALAPSPAAGTPADPSSQPAPQDLPEPDPWTGTTRVTVLIMGLDYRDWEDNQGPPRTDTMMLLTIDPSSQTAGMISIPRDLYVDLPGFGPNKINVAYRFGELYDLPGGGPGLAVRTVEAVLGVNVDYYAQVDFFAFERLIDEIGGVEVDVPQEITVDPIGAGNTVVLQPGPQLLDGPTALAYARSRKTEGGDFDRARRQQQVILAIRDRVLSLDALPRLVLRAPQLYAQFGQSIHTDLSLEQMIQLAWLAQQIPPENIKRGLIGPNQAVEGRSPEDEAILQPIPAGIRQLVEAVFSTVPGTVTAQGNELAAQALQEAARIRLVDASGVEGLGQDTAAYLRGLGLNVTLRLAGEPVSSTRIIDHRGLPATVKYLLEVMQLDRSHVDTLYDPGSSAEIEILLGADWARENPLP